MLNTQVQKTDPTPRLTISSPKKLVPFTSLPVLSKSDTLDVFNAQRYFHIIDNPILYSEPNAVSFDLGEIKVGLALYSPSGTHQATAYQAAIEEMMKAQKAFLGDANDTPSYDILLHLMDMERYTSFWGYPPRKFLCRYQEAINSY